MLNNGRNAAMPATLWGLSRSWCEEIMCMWARKLLDRGGHDVKEDIISGLFCLPRWSISTEGETWSSISDFHQLSLRIEISAVMWGDMTRTFSWPFWDTSVLSVRRVVVYKLRDWLAAFSFISHTKCNCSKKNQHCARYMLCFLSCAIQNSQDYDRAKKNESDPCASIKQCHLSYQNLTCETVIPTQQMDNLWTKVHGQFHNVFALKHLVKRFIGKKKRYCKNIASFFYAECGFNSFGTSSCFRLARFLASDKRSYQLGRHTFGFWTRECGFGHMRSNVGAFI